MREWWPRGAASGIRAAVAATAVLAGVSAAVATAGVRQQEEPFPHREHAGLFPFCTGCHSGVPVGDGDAFYPEPGLCGRCHDGGELERVSWSRPEPRPTNLRFTHGDHLEATRGDTALACRDCHSPAGAPRMTVRHAVPEGCLACHAHRAEEHLADAACATCHVPLARTGFTLTRLRELPEPESHARAAFLPEIHGELAEAGTASCATCHTRERCASCHVDAGRVTAIAELSPAAAGMSLPAFEARYSTPASHRDPAWIEAHGRAASAEACSTCHTRRDCQSCHTPPLPAAVAGVPAPGEVRAPGVGVARRAPGSHDSPFFPTDHGVVAAASAGSCTTCHTESTCAECHAEEGAPSAGGGPGGSGSAGPTPFHPPDYMAQHAADAYGSRLECSNCHDAAVFCRDCHRQTGMGSEGRLGPAYHDAQPLWVFRHGQPARQGLESCASCHRQTDCLQCHSTVGSFRVNPHGPNFDPGRYADRNRAVCFACHLEDPLGGG